MNDFDGTQIPPEWRSQMQNPNIQHKKLKKTWKGRLLDALLWFFDRRTLKFIGAYIIYSTLVCHFDIHFSIWESVFMGLGLGLAVD